LLRKYCNEGASVVIHFWVPAQKRRKCKKIKNIFGRKIKNNNSEKKMLEGPENCYNLVKEVQNTKIEICQYFVD